MNKDLKDFEIYIARKDNLLFKIIEDLPGAGWYFYVFQEGQCLYDVLQDTLQDCQEEAFDEFGVPITSWEKQ